MHNHDVLKRRTSCWQSISIPLYVSRKSAAARLFAILRTWLTKFGVFEAATLRLVARTLTLVANWLERSQVIDSADAARLKTNSLANSPPYQHCPPGM